VTKGANWRSPETKYKRAKNAFAVTSIALTMVPFGTKLLELPMQSLIGSPGTLLGVRIHVLMIVLIVLSIYFYS